MVARFSIVPQQGHNCTRHPISAAVFGLITKCAPPHFARVDRLPHGGKELRGMVVATNDPMGFPDQLRAVIAGDLAKQVIHMQDCPFGIRHRHDSVLVGRSVEPGE